jgi:bifunctional non-homologous end joining protein LigD
VVVPIQRRTGWDEAKEFCRAVSQRFVDLDPSLYLATMSKAARKGKIFIDYFRNDAGATSVAAYSTRSRTGAPVSAPVAWSELGANLKSDQFNVRNLPKRLAKIKEDPWATINDVRQSITAAMKKRLGL